MKPETYNTIFSDDDFFNYPISDQPTISKETLEIDSKQIKEYLVEFSTASTNYCVGLVDMVDSTQITAKLGNSKSSRYMQIFLNSMSRILSRFGGFVIKNVGDCLFYYFPESCRPGKTFGFLSCLESSLTMIESRDFICQRLVKEGLPPVNYRISADYGSVIIMKQNNSNSLDMIGPPVNVCSKINRLAKSNQFVIGSDLKEMLKGIREYSFKKIGAYDSGFKFGYPVFSVNRVQ